MLLSAHVDVCTRMPGGTRFYHSDLRLSISRCYEKQTTRHRAAGGMLKPTQHQSEEEEEEEEEEELEEEDFSTN